MAKKLAPIIVILAIALLCTASGYLVGRNYSLLFGSEGATASLLKRQYWERGRVTSPDGMVDAILLEIETNQLSANEWMICLASADTDSKNLARSHDPILFYGNRFKNLRLLWKEAKFLEIHYDSGHIMDFRNEHWIRGIRGHEYYNIELRLVPGSANTLPD